MDPVFEYIVKNHIPQIKNMSDIENRSANKIHLSSELLIKYNDNKYEYVNNNPVNYIDPDGLWGLTVWKYCGPGSWGGDPKNCYDRACKNHDDCYAQCKSNWLNRWRNILTDRCSLLCDVALFLEWKMCWEENKCKKKEKK